MATYRDVLAELKAVIQPEKAEFLPRFFKAFPGGYGEGDKFLGVIVPDQRRIARKFRDLSSANIVKLLKSPWHECRLTGLLILVHQFQAATGQQDQRRLVEMYLDLLDGVNNWDLVDSSAHKILGQYMLTHPKWRQPVRRLSTSSDMWRQRVSVIATLPLIKAGQFDEILDLAQRFLTHPHDLMHKAVGWMLREVGKQNMAVLRAFLQAHVGQMPRTMLRYAIEKMPPAERKDWLNR